MVIFNSFYCFSQMLAGSDVTPAIYIVFRLPKHFIITGVAVGLNVLELKACALPQ
jgi:hypothetical protein